MLKFRSISALDTLGFYDILYFLEAIDISKLVCKIRPKRKTLSGCEYASSVYADSNNQQETL